MLNINDGWQFAKGESGEYASVNIPHDWLIAEIHEKNESAMGCYKRTLNIAFSEGQRVLIHFDGVYMDSTLFVNDKWAGEWKYGYTAFEYDITDYLLSETDNQLLLKVNYKSNSARWYTGAGLYRDVHVKVKNACHFVSDGINITTKKIDGHWAYEVDAEVETDGKAYEIRHQLLEEGEIIAWDIEHPKTYTMRSELLVNGMVTDTEETRFGFREIAFTTDRGFFLNGRRVEVKGVCLHHDLGSLGAAIYPDAIRRQLTILKTMGVNAIRTAHNPPAAIFMDLADEMGFLVMSEIVDMWKKPKTTYDYARFFDEWIEKDVASWIRRDRNHPSVIMWSVGNEIHDTHMDANDGLTTMNRLIALVRQHDPNNHAPTTLCSNYMPWENTQKCADAIKLIGYNYGTALYESHHKAHPDWIIYGAETCSTVQSRGVYHFPLSQSILADDDLQCSALGNSSTSWGAKHVEACLQEQKNAPYSFGQFIWVGQDHIGEPTPYHTKNSYLGHIDTAGFPKDSYYIFQAAWTDYKISPMLHLFPYWDFSPGQMVDVRVCSNAPVVELFLNEESLGKVNLKETERFVADWHLAYQKGTIRAVAYDERDNIIAESSKQSFGDVHKIVAESDIFGELAFLTITAVDQEERSVENANCRVDVFVENGELLALDNGDSTDPESYQTNSKRLFNGKLLAIVKCSDGVLPSMKAVLNEKDIPIRKIELTLNDYDISAQIFPPNATYNDLEWRLTDATGIDSMFGQLDVRSNKATIIPKGDGEVYVRCATKNGREHITLISQHKTTICGTGKVFFDPYTYVFAGHYNDCNVEPGNGNERGVATLRHGETHVGFNEIDFGDYGSDEMTIDLFAMTQDPVPFELWEGMPLKGGKQLSAWEYNKGSIWNTYQDMSFKLPYRLRGMKDLCLVFRQKVHIKGFFFRHYQKALQKLFVTECNHIYGDSYSIQENAIEQIGNNVSIVFEQMDFGDDGVEHVSFGWRSSIAKNSVQIVFADENTRIQKVIDLNTLDHSETYASATYPLGESICGKKTVTLIFLPGCSLDLSWIKFQK